MSHNEQKTNIEYLKKFVQAGRLRADGYTNFVLPHSVIEQMIAIQESNPDILTKILMDELHRRLTSPKRRVL